VFHHQVTQVRQAEKDKKRREVVTWLQQSQQDTNVLNGGKRKTGPNSKGRERKKQQRAQAAVKK